MITVPADYTSTAAALVYQNLFRRRSNRSRSQYTIASTRNALRVPTAGSSPFRAMITTINGSVAPLIYMRPHYAAAGQGCCKRNVSEEVGPRCLRPLITTGPSSWSLTLYRVPADRCASSFPIAILTALMFPTTCLPNYRGAPIGTCGDWRFHHYQNCKRVSQSFRSHIGFLCDSFWARSLSFPESLALVHVGGKVYEHGLTALSCHLVFLVLRKDFIVGLTYNKTAPLFVALCNLMQSFGHMNRASFFKVTFRQC
ncbi:hypothetical protein PM082_002893 [Marasmius tenuissimus]|nr:hypothetical protein PM082_002893 [Marasmius tenuissimus]